MRALSLKGSKARRTCDHNKIKIKKTHHMSIQTQRNLIADAKVIGRATKTPDCFRIRCKLGPITHTVLMALMIGARSDILNSSNQGNQL